MSHHYRQEIRYEATAQRLWLSLYVDGELLDKREIGLWGNDLRVKIEAVVAELQDIAKRRQEALDIAREAVSRI